MKNTIEMTGAEIAATLMQALNPGDELTLHDGWTLSREEADPTLWQLVKGTKTFHAMTDEKTTAQLVKRFDKSADFYRELVVSLAESEVGSEPMPDEVDPDAVGAMDISEADLEGTEGLPTSEEILAAVAAKAEELGVKPKAKKEPKVKAEKPAKVVAEKPKKEPKVKAEKPAPVEKPVEHYEVVGDFPDGSGESGSLVCRIDHVPFMFTASQFANVDAKAKQLGYKNFRDYCRHQLNYMVDRIADEYSQATQFGPIAK